MSTSLLADDLTTFTSLLAEVAPIEDGSQTNLQDQQVNLSTCSLAGDLTTFTSLLAEVAPIEDGRSDQPRGPAGKPEHLLARW
jgi:hypothetical protein